MSFAAVLGTLIFVVYGCSIHLSKSEMTKLGLNRKDFINQMKK